MTIVTLFHLLTCQFDEDEDEDQDEDEDEDQDQDQDQDQDEDEDEDQDEDEDEDEDEIGNSIHQIPLHYYCLFIALHIQCISKHLSLWQKIGLWHIYEDIFIIKKINLFTKGILVGITSFLIGIAPLEKLHRSIECDPRSTNLLMNVNINPAILGLTQTQHDSQIDVIVRVGDIKGGVLFKKTAVEGVLFMFHMNYIFSRANGLEGTTSFIFKLENGVSYFFLGLTKYLTIDENHKEDICAALTLYVIQY
ncbi:hypothetical protein ACJX0J_011338 [Zea mays]